MRASHSAATTLALLAALCATAGTASAQLVTVLTGRTLDQTSDAVIPAVAVELLSTDRRVVATAVTDSAGRFRFRALDGGSYLLRAGSIGFTTVTTPVLDLPKGDTVDVIIRLSVDAVALAPLEVVARAAPLARHVGLAGFLSRVQRGTAGRVVLREEIETRSPRHNSDLLITAGVSVMDRRVFMKRSGCAPTVYLDGTRLTYEPKSSRAAPAEAFEAINLLSPSDIEGIEVHAGPATMPAEFVGPNAGCGVVALWTRRQ